MKGRQRMDIKAKNIYKSREIYLPGVLYLLILVASVVFLQKNYEGYRALKLYFLIVFPTTILGAILLTMRWSKPIKELFAKEKWGYIALIGILAAQLLAAIPMLTQPYLFMDELRFNGSIRRDILQFIPHGRPLAFFISPFYDGIYWTTSTQGRLVSTCVAMLLTTAIYLFALKTTESVHFASALTLFTCVTSSMMDMISFLAAYPMLWGLLFSSISVFLSVEAEKEFQAKRRTGWFWLGASYCALLLGFNCYAITTPIVFFLLGIRILKKNENKELFSSLAIYACVFLASAITYYASVGFFCNRYNIVGQVAARGALTADVSFYIEKMRWFITEVFPQGIYRIYDALSFGRLTTRSNLYWATGIVDELGSILCGAYYVFVAVGLFFLLRRRRNAILVFVLEILLSVASFYPFLILPESNYMSYYAFPCFCMCCLLFIAALCGYYRLARQKRKETCIKHVVICGLAFFLAIEFNSYNISWIKYNEMPFTVAKTTLLNQWDVVERTKAIYVIGAAAPVQLDELSILTMQQVLYDLGENPGEYSITCTLNGNYSKGIGTEVFASVYSSATKEEQALLDCCYTVDNYYKIYWANDGQITAEDSQRLRELFMKTGIIPSEEDAVWIDLRSVNQWRVL